MALAGPAALLVGLVHGPSLEAYFVGDDFIHLEQVFTSPWNLLANDDPQRWFRPLTKLLFALDHLAWGLDPRGYHLTNLALHTANTLLVTAVARRILGSGPPAILAGLLFLVHPAHAITVGWISARADLMAAGWTLIAVLALALHRRSPSRAVLAGLAAASVMAVASKETGVAVLAVLFALDRLGAFDEGRPPPWRVTLATTAALVGAVVGFLLVRVWVLDAIVGGYGARRLLPTPWLPFEIAFAAFRLLAAVPGVPVREPWRLPLALLATGVVVGAIAATLRRDPPLRRVLLLGTAWFLTALAPAATVLEFRRGDGGDRYLYLPAVGVALVQAMLLSRLAGVVRARRGVRAALVIVAAPVVTFLGLVSRHETSGWGATLGAVPDIQRQLLATTPPLVDDDVVLIFNPPDNPHGRPPGDVMLYAQMAGALARPYFALTLRANPYRLPEPPGRWAVFAWRERERRLVRVEEPPGSPAETLPAWSDLAGWRHRDVRRVDGRWEVSGAGPAFESPAVAVRTADVVRVELTVETFGCGGWLACGGARLVDVWRPLIWRLEWKGGAGDRSGGASVPFRVPVSPGRHRVVVHLAYDYRWFAAGSVSRLVLLPRPGRGPFEVGEVRLVSRYARSRRSAGARAGRPPAGPERGESDA